MQKPLRPDAMSSGLSRTLYSFWDDRRLGGFVAVRQRVAQDRAGLRSHKGAYGRDALFIEHARAHLLLDAGMTEDRSLTEQRQGAQQRLWIIHRSPEQAAHQCQAWLEDLTPATLMEHLRRRRRLDLRPRPQQ